ncbi:MAG: hypothetical protein PUF33_08600 [Solobacterium sp.]|nr:hypothetical protein [Solobacterium sp.]
MVHGDAYNLLHLNVKEVKKLEYSGENYNRASLIHLTVGAANKLCEYTITSDILSIERVNLYLSN